MMLIQCVGRMNLGHRLAAHFVHLVEPCAAPLAVLVDHVALSLDVRGFARLAQLLEPCDALLAVLVDHVALFPDERVFAQVAQLVEPCDALLAINDPYDGDWALGPLGDKGMNTQVYLCAT